MLLEQDVKISTDICVQQNVCKSDSTLLSLSFIVQGTETKTDIVDFFEYIFNKVAFHEVHIKITANMLVIARFGFVQATFWLGK